MVARAQTLGYPIEFSGTWKFSDDASPLDSDRPCAYCGEKQTSMLVKIPAKYASNGQEKLKLVGIDYCIAPLIKVLNDGGISTVACCCGHGKNHGVISLQDGRELIIMSVKEREQHFNKDK
jgi:hypothetical protein